MACLAAHANGSGRDGRVGSARRHLHFGDCGVKRHIVIWQSVGNAGASFETMLQVGERAAPPPCLPFALLLEGS